MFARNLKRLPRLVCVQQMQSSSGAATATATKAEQYKMPIINEFRTAETEAAKHTDTHIAKFYTISPEHKKQLFTGGGLPKQFDTQAKTFTECCLMVRPAALEIMDYIKRTDFKKPTVRYVLYGVDGAGKSLTMAHLLHYGLQNNFVLVHVPWVPNWMKKPKEQADSTVHENFIDLPFDAASWLKHFRTQNATILPSLDLKTSKEYVWSKRESTPAGSPILELVDHGIARIKFACETVAALLSELKQQATAGRCKVMVAIDGFNAFFHPETRIFGDNKQLISPDRITLTQPFLDITNYNWTNGVCILSVDRIGMTEGYMESHMPFYLLGREGFEHLDPFVPVLVENYTEKEFTSCVNYYLDRNWIQKRPPGFEEQLKYMSNRNPYTLMRLTRSL